MKKLKIAAILVASVVFAFSLCGCGNSGAKSDLSNTLVYAGENEDTINPVLTNHDELTDIIFSGLMKFDAHGKPVDMVSQKSICKKTGKERCPSLSGSDHYDIRA